MEILNVTNCLNKRRARKNKKQKEKAIFRKLEELYLKRLHDHLCYEMLLDKYFDDEEMFIFPRHYIPPAMKTKKVFIMPIL